MMKLCYKFLTSEIYTVVISSSKPSHIKKLTIAPKLHSIKTFGSTQNCSSFAEQTQTLPGQYRHKKSSENSKLSTKQFESTSVKEIQLFSTMTIIISESPV